VHPVCHNLAIEDIHDRRQVQLLAPDIEFSDVRDPFLLKADGRELKGQQIGHGGIRLGLVGAVFPWANPGLQAQHQPLHHLGIDDQSLLPQPA
jgi:hypothetical protein